mgnify:FL=1
MPKHKNVNVKPSYVIYDCCNDELASPLCTTVKELQQYLDDLDHQASEGDYVVLKVVESDIKISKGGWSFNDSK